MLVSYFLFKPSAIPLRFGFLEKISEGIGKTRKEAQCQAADTSLRNLAGELRSTPCSFYSQLELLMCNVIGGRGGFG